MLSYPWINRSGLNAKPVNKYPMLPHDLPGVVLGKNQLLLLGEIKV